MGSGQEHAHTRLLEAEGDDQVLGYARNGPVEQGAEVYEHHGAVLACAGRGDGSTQGTAEL